MSPQIFVSYARKTPDFEPFLIDLKNHLPEKYHIWIDKQIKPTEEWQRSIDKAIEDSFAVLVILAPQSSESKYVTYEWSYALGKGRAVITLLHTQTEDIHPRLESFNWLDFSRRYHEPWDGLIEALDDAHAKFQASTEGTQLAFTLLQDGQTKRQSNELDNALDTLTKALDLAPDHLKDDIHYEIAAIYREKHAQDNDEWQQNIADALKHLENALKYNPRLTKALVMQGEFYRDQGDAEPDKDKQDGLYAQSEGRFWAALEIQPDLLDENGESVWGSLGGILKRRGNIPKAIEYYNRAARVKRSSYPFNNLGLLHLQAGNVQEMRRSFSIVRLLAEKRVNHHNVIDDWAYNDYLVSLTVLDELLTAAPVLETILMVSQRTALESLLRTLKAMTNLPDAMQNTLDFIATTINRINARLAEMGGAD